MAPESTSAKFDMTAECGKITLGCSRLTAKTPEQEVILATTYLRLEKPVCNFEVRVYVLSGDMLTITGYTLEKVDQIPAVAASRAYIERSLDRSVLFRLPGRGIAKGVNRYEGSARSLGLMYGGLLQFVQADPLYGGARAATEDLTICGELCRANIFVIVKYHLHTFLPDGDIIEFGSYKGGMALFMSYVLNGLGSGGKVYALDTFEGMPVSSAGHDTHRIGDFGDADLSALEKRIRESGLGNIVPVKGLFRDTFPKFAEGRKFALAHIDCDQYESVADAVDCLKGHMAEGAYMIFDDPLFPTCPGAMEAVEESLYHRDKLHAEQVFPHLVFRNFSGSGRAKGFVRRNPTGRPGRNHTNRRRLQGPVPRYPGPRRSGDNLRHDRQ